jgi:transcriptional regulator with PAS, ATPase and Fis domain
LLGQRRHDIPRLVWFFIHAHQRELGRRITNVPPPVVDALQKHSWPGNVLAIGKPRFADGQMGILTGGCS